jgi:hypothetical protein
MFLIKHMIQYITYRLLLFIMVKSVFPDIPPRHERVEFYITVELSLFVSDLHYGIFDITKTFYRTEIKLSFGVGSSSQPTCS